MQQIEHHDHHYVDLYGHRTADVTGTGSGVWGYRKKVLEVDGQGDEDVWEMTRTVLFSGICRVGGVTVRFT